MEGTSSVFGIMIKAGAIPPMETRYLQRKYSILRINHSHECAHNHLATKYSVRGMHRLGGIVRWSLVVFSIFMVKPP